MKKHITLLVLTLFTVKTFAQDTIPNPSFERWTAGTGYEDPTGWTTPNSLTITYGGEAEVTKTDTAYSGNYAARLETDTFSIPSVISTGVPGFVLLGSINIDHSTFSGSITGGVPFTGRPDTFYGYFKYLPAKPTDAAEVYAILTNNTNGVRDTVAFGRILISGTDTPWSKFSMPINYFINTQVPDTIQLALISSSNFFNHPPIGTKFYVDDLSFSADTSVAGINTVLNKGFSISCYPNPANTNLNVLISEPQAGMLIKVYDALGRNILVANNKGLITSLNVSQLSNGIYFYEVFDSNGNSLKADKFTVVR